MGRLAVHMARGHAGGAYTHSMACTALVVAYSSNHKHYAYTRNRHIRPSVDWSRACFT